MKKGEEKDSLAMVGEESRKLLGAPDVAWPFAEACTWYHFFASRVLCAAAAFGLWAFGGELRN